MLRNNGSISHRNLFLNEIHFTITIDICRYDMYMWAPLYDYVLLITCKTAYINSVKYIYQCCLWVLTGILHIVGISYVESCQSFLKIFYLIMAKATRFMWLLLAAVRCGSNLLLNLQHIIDLCLIFFCQNLKFVCLLKLSYIKNIKIKL